MLYLKNTRYFVNFVKKGVIKMKKKELLVFALFALGAVAYAEKAAVVPPIEKNPVEKHVEATANQKEVLTFEKENAKGDVIVESSDRFETATLTNGEQKFQLKRVVSGSGIKLETEDKKVSVHFAKGEGVFVEDGKDIMLKEKKK